MKNQTQNIWQSDEDLIRNALRRVFDDETPQSDRLERLIERMRLQECAAFQPRT
jgi:Arc/MetJ-type ribon-helix-helix transcriptional regulator